jgi:hypothetical protein
MGDDTYNLCYRHELMVASAYDMAYSSKPESLQPAWGKGGVHNASGGPTTLRPDNDQNSLDVDSETSLVPRAVLTTLTSVLNWFADIHVVPMQGDHSRSIPSAPSLKNGSNQSSLTR